MSATKVKLGPDPSEENKEHDNPVSGEEVDWTADNAGAETEASEPEATEGDNEPKDDGSDGESPDENSEPFNLEDLDPELEVWPGGPTVGQTLAWKEEFGEIYTTSLTMEYHVMWRPLNRGEYKKHVRQMEEISQSGKVTTNADLNMLQEEILTEMCLLHPKITRAEMNGKLAGLPSIIAQQVMEASGFSALEVRQI